MLNIIIRCSYLKKSIILSSKTKVNLNVDSFLLMSQRLIRIIIRIPMFKCRILRLYFRLHGTVATTENILQALLYCDIKNKSTGFLFLLILLILILIIIIIIIKLILAIYVCIFRSLIYHRIVA